MTKEILASYDAWGRMTKFGQPHATPGPTPTAPAAWSLSAPMDYELEIKDEVRAAWRALPEDLLRQIPMSTAIAKTKGRPPGRPNLDRQITQTKTVLCKLRYTLEDLDDRRELARARERNAAKPGTDWETVRKELGL